MKETTLFRGIALFLCAVSFLDFLLIMQQESPAALLWFCNVMLVVLAIGFWMRSSLLITATLIGALSVQLPWVIDFFSILIFHYPLFDVASYLFDYGYHSLQFWVELDHLLLLPLSVLGAYRLGVHKRGWLMLCAIGGAMMTLSALLSTWEENINCVFYSCFVSTPKVGPYLLRFIVLLTLLALVFFCINWALRLILAARRGIKKAKKKKQRR